MAANPPFLFSLLALPLLAGMGMFVVLRRPRQPLTWTYVGVMAGLVVFYLVDVILYQPGITVQSGLVWQFIQNQGAYLVIVSALAANFLFRDRRLQTWEWAVVGFIAVRMAVDIPWLAGHLSAGYDHTCLTVHGLPRLTCPPEDRLAIATGAVSGACVAVLFISTALNAAEPRRHILRRYILWIVLLLAVGGLGLQLLTLAGQVDFGLIPTQPTTWFAILIGIRLLLALEEEATGVRFPTLGWRILVWFVMLLTAVVVDLSWNWLGVPVWTPMALAVGIAGSGALLINSLIHHAASTQETRAGPSSATPSQPPVDPAPSVAAPPPPKPLCIYLFGPLRMVRDGEVLPNTAEVWRSAKTRSLLALLALRHKAGVTQVEIIDALWPPGSELDVEAERNSSSAFRSYLSTLRRVLDPIGPRGNDRWIAHEAERYFLRSDVWVDVWEFEALADEAEARLAQGRQADGLASWRQAVALYQAEGLLPDEVYLPAPLLEPARENLRQRWLSGLHRLAQAEQDHARAAGLWEAIHQAEPLNEAACHWLTEHYRSQGNRNGLRMVLQRRRMAESEMDLP
ncbi:MAG TPA: bacterial transcriptional activator domain-containing protein [Anaerolineae bacterium]|nr:bacterial transcriptional activator domain-containing protein [Anaerolineae bacterium]HNU04503.1 bacterial transcriptional activator domain-containing protein [Anaerolineae bacterium]